MYLYFSMETVCYKMLYKYCEQAVNGAEAVVLTHVAHVAGFPSPSFMHSLEHAKIANAKILGGKNMDKSAKKFLRLLLVLFSLMSKKE